MFIGGLQNTLVEGDAQKMKNLAENLIEWGYKGDAQIPDIVVVTDVVRFYLIPC